MVKLADKLTCYKKDFFFFILLETDFSSTETIVDWFCYLAFSYPAVCDKEKN